MNFLENKNDLEITGKNLVKTIAQKHDLDTYFIDNIEAETEKIKEQQNTLFVQQNFKISNSQALNSFSKQRFSKIYTDELVNKRIINPARVLSVNKANKTVLLTKRNEVNLKERVNYRDFDRKSLDLTSTKFTKKKVPNKMSEENISNMEKASKNLSSHKLQELSLK